jgi:hypothetical protein
VPHHSRETRRSYCFTAREDVALLQLDCSGAVEIGAEGDGDGRKPAYCLPFAEAESERFEPNRR